MANTELFGNVQDGCHGFKMGPRNRFGGKGIPVFAYYRQHWWNFVMKRLI